MSRFARPVLVAAASLGLLTPVAGQARPVPLDALGLARETAARVGTTLAPDAGPISSDNISLLTTLPGSFAGMRIVGTKAYVTGWSGLTILDISTPEAPTPVGELPLPHFENEDVDSDGKVVLITNDRGQAEKGAVLYVIDVQDPAAPHLAAVLPIGALLGTERGPGHIANCVKDGCEWVWLTGGTRVWVINLKDPAHPLLVSAFRTPAAHPNARFAAGVTHDVERDAQGRVWVTGSGGAAAYDVKDPAHPKLLSTTGTTAHDPAVNDFILHNSQRPEAAKYTPRTAKNHKVRATLPGELLITTEEDYIDDTQTPPGGCNGQGKMATWDARDYTKGRAVTLLNQWKTELGGVPLLEGSKAPVTANCSSHWFTERNGLVANGWYEQGLRILDVRLPREIRQVAYWLPPNAVTWAANWVTDSIIYTSDVARGIDVLKLSDPAAHAPTVVAPIRASWLGAGTGIKFLMPSETFGGACLVPVWAKL